MKHRFRPRPGTGHLFITIRWRRWCLGCDLFQQGPSFPPPRFNCSWSTPYAREHPERRPQRGINQERE